MKKCRKNIILVAILLIAVLLTACGGRKTPVITETADPHAGMVSVSDGAGGLMWVPLHEGIPVSDLEAGLFYKDGEYISYSGPAPATMRGIDVSEHQGEIDWQLVAQDGVEFAMVRAGYRGYTEGTLNEDLYFRQNMEGAAAAGIKLGVYFFSQAVTVEEAREEARFVLELVKDFELAFPIAFDWENIGSEAARTDGVDAETLTDSCLAFCDIVEEAGYESAVYFYRRLGYYEYDLERISHLAFWVGAPGELPDFYYEHDIWQYSFTGRVSGIGTDVDLNLFFDNPEPAPAVTDAESATE